MIEGNTQLGFKNFNSIIFYYLVPHRRSDVKSVLPEPIVHTTTVSVAY